MEWTNDTIPGVSQPSPRGFFREFNTSTNDGSLGYDGYRPSNKDWGSIQNMGQIFPNGASNNTIYGIIRGKTWNNPEQNGVFTIHLFNIPTSTYLLLGFRCVLR